MASNAVDISDKRPAPGRPCATTGLVPRPRPTTARPADHPARRGPRWWLWARRVVEVGFVCAGVYALWRERTQVLDAARLLDHLHWPFIAAAAAAEVASMVAFARLQRWLLRAGDVDLALGPMVEITFAGNALSVSLPGGAAWSAAWAYEQLRRRGADRTLAVWVLLVAGALSSFALFVLLAVGVWVAGPTGPAKDARVPVAILAAIPVIALIGFLAARRSGRVRRAGLAVARAVEHHLPGGERAARGLRAFGGRLEAVQPTGKEWAASLGLALLNWVYDATCLLMCILALGVSIPWRGLLVAYGLAQIGASLPITPGGIGIVEGSLSFALIAYGVVPDQAVAVVLLYRIISFWALVPIGWGAWGWLELQTREGGPLRRHHPWAWHHGTPAQSR